MASVPDERVRELELLLSTASVGYSRLGKELFAAEQRIVALRTAAQAMAEWLTLGGHCAECDHGAPPHDEGCRTGALLALLAVDGPDQVPL